MDRSKAKKFLDELYKLQEKYGIHISSSYEEEIDYDYEETPYVSGVSSYLVLVNEDGIEVSVDDLLNENFTCYYCGRNVDLDNYFCNESCETKYRDKYYP